MSQSGDLGGASLGVFDDRPSYGMAATFHEEAVAFSCRCIRSLCRSLVSHSSGWGATGSQRRSRGNASAASLHGHIRADRPGYWPCLLVCFTCLRAVSCSSRLRLAGWTIKRRRREHALSLAFWSHFSDSRARTLGIMSYPCGLACWSRSARTA